MFFYVGDLVTRNSYNNDIVFSIKKIENNKVYLKGFKERICADSYIDDLQPYNFVRTNEQNEDLPIKNGNFLNG